MVGSSMKVRMGEQPLRRFGAIALTDKAVERIQFLTDSM
jgi:hypothetical protein